MYVLYVLLIRSFLAISLGVIVLLNVLIAVVSDSYQKSVEHSAQLFGRYIQCSYEVSLLVK